LLVRSQSHIVWYVRTYMPLGYMYQCLVEVGTAKDHSPLSIYETISPAKVNN